MAARTDALVVGLGEGTIVSGCAGGCVLETKAPAADTNGRYAFREMTVVAGFPSIPPRFHHHDDEALYGLEGDGRRDR